MRKKSNVSMPSQFYMPQSENVSPVKVPREQANTENIELGKGFI